MSYVCQTTNPQGMVFDGCNMTGVRTGMYVRHAIQACPDGRVGDNSIQFRDTGFDIGNVGIWRFPDNTFFLEGDISRSTTNPAVDMRFIAASNVSITGGAFGTYCGNGESQDCGKRVNIYIDAVTQSYGHSGANNFLIGTGIFGDQSQYFALSAVQITPSATNIQVGASNIFNGTFTVATVNDASGQVSTPVGFPTTNNPANPAAVVPNAAGVGPGPTMGSANVPWLANITYAQIVPFAPVGVTFPTVGSAWTIYYDPKGSGDLLASNGSVIRTLAAS